jgi:tetratricopeptide (TPR) repeat protein
MPSDDAIVIQPAAAPLSGQQSGRRPFRPTARSSRRFALRAAVFAVALVVLGGIATFVFVALPEGRGTARPVLSSADAPRQSAGQVAETTPPFRALELAKARESAQERLADFAELQIRLEEEMHVAVWGQADLDAALERANAADQRFLEGAFDVSLAEYSAAVADLNALVAKGERLFAETIEAGSAALRARDHAAATDAFGRAVAMRPTDSAALAGAERAAKLPEITELLREVERARLRGDHDAAHALLRQVRQLDADTDGLAAIAAEIAAARAAAGRAERLSRAFAALEAGDHDAALDAFDKLLKANPNDATAQAGRQQTEQARILAEIDRLRQQALAAARREDWDAALRTYDAALAIDGSLRFAREGRTLVRDLAALSEAMRAVLDDPAALSDDGRFTAARETLRRADQLVDTGERFAARLAAFRGVVERSAQPVTLVLTSDNATEVIIRRQGPVGTFDRLERALRPGRYTIIGSRDGCRDVRIDIVLAADSKPVDVRCLEPLAQAQ